MLRTEHLKVKVKSLAAEARIIRHATHKAKRRVRWMKEHGDEAEHLEAEEVRDTLIRHRCVEVRSEARHSLLAYGFLRGTQYQVMERTCHQGPDWERVARLVGSFGGKGTKTRFDNELKAWSSVVGLAGEQEIEDGKTRCGHTAQESERPVTP